MSRPSVNSQRVYFNSQGRLPQVPLDAQPARIPAETASTHPKLITDTTLRDGSQDPSFALFPNEAKLRYVDLLHELDNGTGRIEAVEVFIYQKRDLWVLDRLLERGYDYPQITTWTRALPKDIKTLVRVSQGRVKETGMLASASDHHIFDKMGFSSKQEAVSKYLAPIMTACEHGIRPRVHLEDVTKADIEGWVVPFIQRVMEETGGLARFRLCDTLGVGVPDPYATLPYGIPKLTSTVAEATGAELEFHGHNDFGLAVANSMAAYTYGAKRANAAFGGLGERTGNAPLEQVLVNYIRAFGDPGFNLAALSEIADLIGREVVTLYAKAPVVGRGIFSTQAGLHQTGVEKQKAAPGGLIYLPFDPAMVGQHAVETNRVGSLSGMDGIAAALNRAMEAATGEKGAFTAQSKRVKQIYDYVQQAYDGTYDEAQGRFTDYRTTFFTEEELLAQADGMIRNVGPVDPLTAVQ